MAIECNTDNIDDGDNIVLDLEQGIVFNLTKNISINIIPISPIMKKLVKDNGLINHIKKYGDLKID